MKLPFEELINYQEEFLLSPMSKGGPVAASEV